MNILKYNNSGKYKTLELETALEIIKQNLSFERQGNRRLECEGPMDIM